MVTILEAKVSAILSSIFRHFEEFELRVKPLGVEVIVERDEMDESDIREFLKVLEELRKQGLKIDFRITPSSDSAGLSVQAILSVTFV